MNLLTFLQDENLKQAISDYALFLSLLGNAASFIWTFLKNLAKITPNKKDDKLLNALEDAATYRRKTYQQIIKQSMTKKNDTNKNNGVDS